MSTAINDLPPLREVITQYDLWAKKSLGQNFLLDLNLTTRIARAAGQLDHCDIIEVGPGPGGLTRALLSCGAKHVYAIERDQRCISAAQDISAAAPGRLSIIEDDAMSIDYTKLGTAPKKIVANLPYNIATPLLLKWLEDLSQIESMTLMFQKEVAERIVAHPGNKTYGRLSVIAQWLCDAHMDFSVSPKAFTPPPKVTSAIITLIPRTEPLMNISRKSLETVTATAFGQRRKMLRASLKPLNLDLASLGIEPTARAEDIDVLSFCKLAQAYEKTQE
jgi:16S rRNA (adenine1518-N6/adenine1519-N6)-dimethyltransferase